MKHMFTLAAGAALTCALGCGGNSGSPTAPGQAGSSESTGAGANAIVSLRIEGPSTLTVGETAQLKVVANLAGGAVADVTAKAVFSVNNSAVAAVSVSGELRALAPGDCALTALVGSVAANLNTNIRARAGVIARLELRGKLDLEIGEKAQLQAIAMLDTGDELDVTAKASFTSSNDAVLRVSVSGLLEAVGVGACDLLSIVDGIRASVKINVRGRGEHITRIDIRGKVTLDLGEKIQLQAIATLNTGAQVDVTAKASFTSGNEAVLRVSASGLLEAVGVGTSDVLSSVDDVRTSMNVNVRRGSGGDQVITRLEIRGNTNPDLGEKTQLQAIGTLGNGAQVDATPRATFNSSNEAVLRVSPSGQLEGVGIGTSDLVAAVDGAKASVTVHVRRGEIARIDIVGATDLAVGARANVQIMATTVHGARVEVTGESELSSSNGAVLRVSAGGVIEALGPGSCDLIAISGGIRAMVRLNVTAKAVVILRLRIDGAISLQLGQTVLLKVIATMSDDTEVDVTARVNWTASNGTCGLSLGILTALAPGDCLITVSLDGVRASVTVNVRASVATVVKLRIEGLTALRIGQTAQLKAIATMSDNTEVDVTGRVSWTTNNAASLLVNVSGILTALLPGDCLITAVLDGVKASVTVKVTLL